MKLKLIVTSMMISGLISSPLFAATQKHTEEAMPVGGYKGEIFATPCPKVSVYSPIMDAMSQNVRRAKATIGCDKPIQLAGGINFDTQFGNLNQGFMGENNSRFALNDAYVNATGNINPWVSAFVELSYNNIQDTALNSANFNRYYTTRTTNQATLPGLYSAGYTLDALDLQQGYITLGNPEMFPLFLKLGKQFQDFGRYTIHPITRSMTQVMTETLQTSAELSFISNWNTASFHGSLFTFQNQIPEVNDDNVGTNFNPGNIAPNHGNTNFGAQLGIGQVSAQLGWDIGIGYINDMMGVNDIAYAAAFRKSSISVTSLTDSDAINVSQSYYFDSVSGLTAYGMVNSGPFSLSAHYVTALQEFDPADFTHDMLGFIPTNSSDDGAQPWAADLQVAYGFNAWDKAQNLYVGYQQSGDAVALYIPKNRWVAGYGIDVLKNTNIGVEYSNDQAYSISDGGNNENSNRVALRVSAMFG